MLCVDTYWAEKWKIAETSKIHIFRTVSPFWPPFEALGSYLDVFSYKIGLEVIRWLFYVVVLETYRCVDFYRRERVRLLCYRTVYFRYIT